MRRRSSAALISVLEQVSLNKLFLPYTFEEKGLAVVIGTLYVYMGKWL